MTIDQFFKLEQEILKRFRSDYQKQIDNKNQYYPSEMEYGEWWEQVNLYSEDISIEDIEV